MLDSLFVVLYFANVYNNNNNDKQRAGFIGVVVAGFLALYTAQFLLHFVLWRSHSEVDNRKTGAVKSPRSKKVK